MYAFGFSDPTRISEDWGTIKNIAAQYVDEIRSVQPEGPYYLGGYSVGGLIALEIASIFLENEEQVGLLVMIDTFPWILESRTNTIKLRESASFASDKVKVSKVLNFSLRTFDTIAFAIVSLHRFGISLSSFALNPILFTHR